MSNLYFLNTSGKVCYVDSTTNITTIVTTGATIYKRFCCCDSRIIAFKNSNDIQYDVYSFSGTLLNSGTLANAAKGYTGFISVDGLNIYMLQYLNGWISPFKYSFSPTTNSLTYVISEQVSDNNELSVSNNIGIRVRAFPSTIYANFNAGSNNFGGTQYTIDGIDLSNPISIRLYGDYFYFIYGGNTNIYRCYYKNMPSSTLAKTSVAVLPLALTSQCLQIYNNVMYVTCNKEIYKYIINGDFSLTYIEKYPISTVRTSDRIQIHMFTVPLCLDADAEVETIFASKKLKDLQIGEFIKVKEKDPIQIKDIYRTQISTQGLIYKVTNKLQSLLITGDHEIEIAGHADKVKKLYKIIPDIEEFKVKLPFNVVNIKLESEQPELINVNGIWCKTME